MSSRVGWRIGLIAIIGTGILSRTIHTGSILFDKYLGDALYAAMVYAILRVWNGLSAGRLAVAAAVIMTAIEFFQMTMIPAHWLSSRHLVVRICARLIGTEFSVLDLCAYAVGIACIHFGSRLFALRTS